MRITVFSDLGFRWRMRRVEHGVSVDLDGHPLAEFFGNDFEESLEEAYMFSLGYIAARGVSSYFPEMNLQIFRSALGCEGASPLLVGPWMPLGLRRGVTPKSQPQGAAA